MKRKILLIGIVVALVLTGCAPAFVADTTAVPTGTTQETATALTTEATTQPSTEPSTVPEETTVPAGETLHRRFIDYGYYGAEMDLYRFVYSGKDPFKNAKIDTGTCVVGSLYEYNDSEDVLRLIADGPIYQNEFIYTRFHYYYVLESDPTVIMRTDRNGKNHTAIYTSELGNVNQVSFYGYEDNGFLLLLLGNKYIVRYNIPAATAEVLHEGENITVVYPDIAGRYGDGPVLYYPDGSEPIMIDALVYGKSDGSRWSYVCETGELKPSPW